MKYINFLFIALSLILVPLMAIRVSAVDQIKSTEFFVSSYESQISSATSTDFQIYIGDNLAGVSSPVKSAYFTVSGVYTGNGSLELKINNDAASSKTFTLPDVGTTPTPFEIIYKDDSNKINPASAGTYSYTLNVVPSGITISGLGEKIEVTHRYVPPSCPDGQSANEKVKTTEFFVADSASQISSATSSQFSVYIGDNLAGVANPVKSVHFVVSGVYTSSPSPSLQLQIDSDAATSKTFNLPDVGSTPTPFEIIYKDDSNKINPASAGTYNYTLNVTPANITISGLGAKVAVSHRYKPPTCGGYPATGELISPIFDTGVVNGASFNSISWKGQLNGGKIRLQLATSNCSNGATNPSTCNAGAWGPSGSDYLGTDCTNAAYYEQTATDEPNEIKCYANHQNKRYFRYKLIICSSGDCSTAGAQTPQVDDVMINWSP